MSAAIGDVIREGGETFRHEPRAVGEVGTEAVDRVGRLTEFEEVGLVHVCLEAE